VLAGADADVSNVLLAVLAVRIGFELSVDIVDLD
jgi:hypothetical protein